MEKFNGVPSVQARTLSGVQKALEAAGVKFIGEPEVNPGVQLVQKERASDE
ncbi:hypothetical protein RYZ26_18690 [Terasakiella sp. A23]|uniref:hypothetical protein n=1 Tax=Terasakiella sp. FCG-A23 TaxID=3080561 RepID=UPI002955230D|nr:hypothetical protein [Terasakiella sp. A23]MDV7341635.1 hypothetical protein [Terasakiella sp. A23]